MFIENISEEEFAYIDEQLIEYNANQTNLAPNEIVYLANSNMYLIVNIYKNSCLQNLIRQEYLTA